MSSESKVKPEEMHGAIPKRLPKRAEPILTDAQGHVIPPFTRDPALLVDDMLLSVSELEQSLLRGNQERYTMQMQLEKERQKVQNLRALLDKEKERNERLVKLIHGGDSDVSSDDGLNMFGEPRQAAGDGAAGGQRRRSSVSAYASISPLLLQQRYDEMSISHKKCRRQLVKKEKQLKCCRCDNMEIQALHEELTNDCYQWHKRLQVICKKYMNLQARRSFEVYKLRNALQCSVDCVTAAKDIFAIEPPFAFELHETFKQNLRLFVEALDFCDTPSHIICPECDH